MRKQILIIKTGATGDVVRTSVLLHAFSNDEVTWITAKKNICVLPEKFSALRRIIAIEDITKSSFLVDQHFDIVLSLDDERKCAEIASRISSTKLTGVYIDKVSQKITYTKDSASWFDLSLISSYSKNVADKLKYNAKESVQFYLYKMIGCTFSGEEYLIPEDIIPNTVPKLIGIEARAGERWKSKRWNGYEMLAENLKQAGYKVRFFEERALMKDFMKDIAECSLIVTGDTLTMHFALALKIKVVALFTCTSPNEIYDYKRMIKVVSPFLWDAFYKTEYVPHAVESITQEMVWNAIEQCKQL
jgi:heptosyltransferase-2